MKKLYQSALIFFVFISVLCVSVKRVYADDCGGQGQRCCTAADVPATDPRNPLDVSDCVGSGGAPMDPGSTKCVSGVCEHCGLLGEKTCTPYPLNVEGSIIRGLGPDDGVPERTGCKLPYFPEAGFCVEVSGPVVCGGDGQTCCPGADSCPNDGDDANELLACYFDYTCGQKSIYYFPRSGPGFYVTVGNEHAPCAYSGDTAHGQCFDGSVCNVSNPGNQYCTKSDADCGVNVGDLCCESGRPCVAP
ncbi:MAG: hypothetical protein WC243_00280, partial [Patescibacteria group bacterium]